MPRLPLAAAFLLLAGSALAVDPHLNRTLVPGGCPACHAGHGTPGSPMLPGPQNDTCLGCHDSQTRADAAIRSGKLGASARPPLLGNALSSGFTHSMSAKAYSRHDKGAVVCTSCHSPHRRSTAEAPLAAGAKKASTRDRDKWEHQLCEECHGGKGPATGSVLDLSRLFDPTSRSFHPVHEAAKERSASVDAKDSGRFIACTDCHGSNEPKGPRGPHGSAHRYLLVAAYPTADGADESAGTYALCYACHDRTKILDGKTFPLHRLHVETQKASCATCHSAHGSVRNRALIRFGEETGIGGVTPSLKAGKLEFLSTAQGSGSCSLTCHGFDHAGESYGPAGPKSILGRATAGPMRAVAPPAPGMPAPPPPRRAPVERPPDAP